MLPVSTADFRLKISNTTTRQLQIRCSITAAHILNKCPASPERLLVAIHKVPTTKDLLTGMKPTLRSVISTCCLKKYQHMLLILENWKRKRTWRKHALT